MTHRDQKKQTETKPLDELRRTLQVKEEKLEFLEKIVHSLPAIVYLFDIHNMRMIWCNRRHKEFIGFDTTGMNLLDEEGDLMKIFKSDQNLALENIQGWRESEDKPGKVVIRITDYENKEQYFYTDHHIFERDEDGNARLVLGIGISMNRQHHSEHEKRILYSEDISATYQYLEEMSDKDLTILNLLSEGYSYKEIGQELNLSVDGVRYHIRNLYQLLEANSCVEAITKAIKYRLIQP